MVDHSEQSPQASVEGALERAEKLRREKRFQEARDLLLDALQHNLEVAQIYFRMGNVFFDQKDYDRAEYAYRRSIDHDSAHVSAQHNLSVVFRKQGRVTESVKQRRKAHKLAMKNPQKVKISEDQKTFLKRYARQVFRFGFGFRVAVIALVVLLVSFVG